MLPLWPAEPLRWAPPSQVNWQWQLTSPVDLTVDADVYDIDLFTNDASVVAQLHAKGRKAICYVSVGSWEPYRPDAGLFPDSVKGKPLDGFADEKWLDIRRIDILGPIMLARLDLCKSKGFDAVEPDNVDGFANSTGFKLSASDQLAYNRYIAKAAHDRGLSVGLKNDVDQLGDLVGDFDWALNEECFQYQECGGYYAFTSAGKSVLQVEYSLATTKFCGTANSLNFNSMQKRLELDAFRAPCRTVSPVNPSIAGITNAASYATGGVSPGEIVVLFGAAMTSGPLLSADSIQLPQTLGGTQVLFDDAPAQIIYVSGGQISAVVPQSVQGKSTTKVTVLHEGIPSAAFSVPVVAAVPGLFTLNAQGTGLAAAVNYPDGKINGVATPAERNGIVLLYATGFTGSDVKVKAGGQYAEVQYAGGVSWSVPGLVQLNVKLPPGVSGPAVEVVLEVGAAKSSTGVVLAIQ